MKKKLALLIALSACVLTGYAQSLSPNVFTTSGTQTTSGNFSLSYSVGQVFSAPLNQTAVTLTQGFQQPDCISAIQINNTISPTTCGLPNAGLSSAISGGNAPYAYLWSNGSTTAAISNLNPGTYSLTVTGVNGCTAATTATVNSSVCPKVNSQTVSAITQNSATITWPATSCANKYRIVLKKSGVTTQTTILVNAPTTSYTLTGLEPNTTYQVRIRTQCSQNGSVVANLSPITSFTTLNSQGFSCLPPLPISSSNITPNSATINWTPATGAIQYFLRYRLSGTTAWTTQSANSSVSTTTLQSLSPSSTYEFQMRTKCNSNPDEFSPYSSLFTFNTPALRLSESEPNAITALLYPNPTADIVNVVLQVPEDAEARISITDISGKVLYNETEFLTAGSNTISYPAGHLASGMYLIHITLNGHTQTLKLIKEHAF
jgi:hypothetical protein